MDLIEKYSAEAQSWRVTNSRLRSILTISESHLADTYGPDATENESYGPVMAIQLLNIVDLVAKGNPLPDAAPELLLPEVISADMRASVRWILFLRLKLLGRKMSKTKLQRALNDSCNARLVDILAASNVAELRRRWVRTSLPENVCSCGGIFAVREQGPAEQMVEHGNNDVNDTEQDAANTSNPLSSSTLTASAASMDEELSSISTDLDHIDIHEEQQPGGDSSRVERQIQEGSFEDGPYGFGRTSQRNSQCSAHTLSSRINYHEDGDDDDRWSNNDYVPPSYSPVPSVGFTDETSHEVDPERKYRNPRGETQTSEQSSEADRQSQAEISKHEDNTPQRLLSQASQSSTSTYFSQTGYNESDDDFPSNGSSDNPGDDHDGESDPPSSSSDSTSPDSAINWSVHRTTEGILSMLNLPNIAFSNDALRGWCDQLAAEVRERRLLDSEEAGKKDQEEGEDGYNVETIVHLMESQNLAAVPTEILASWSADLAMAVHRRHLLDPDANPLAHSVIRVVIEQEISRTRLALVVLGLAMIVGGGAVFWLQFVLEGIVKALGSIRGA